METKTCRACRTVNEGFAIVCRNCGARIGEPPRPGAAVGGGADPGSQPTTSAPPPMPTGPVAAPDQGFGPPPPPGELSQTTHPGVLPKKSNAGIMIAFAVGVLVVGAAVVYFLTRGGGGAFPDELAGHPRSDSEVAQQVEEMFSGFDVAGMSIDVALYGDGEPVAMMMTFTGLPEAATEVPADVFFDGFAAGFAQQQGLGINPSAGIRESSDGADFLCVDAPAGAFGGAGFSGGFGTAQSGAFCVFKGSTIGMVMLFDGTGASAAMPVVQDAYAEIA
jgi:hypothetical protein